LEVKLSIAKKKRLCGGFCFKRTHGTRGHGVGFAKSLKFEAVAAYLNFFSRKN
jgi:hypothetical protein